MNEPVYIDDWPDPGGWHDLNRCRCSRHCHNCGFELTGRQRRYCSDYCGRRWRAELELDRWMSSQSLKPGGTPADT